MVISYFTYLIQLYCWCAPCRLPDVSPAGAPEQSSQDSDQAGVDYTNINPALTMWVAQYPADGGLSQLANVVQDQGDQET